VKQLLLLRHGQAVEAQRDMTDMDRPLSPRGRAEVLDAAQCIADSRLRCDALLASPAVRTRETATIVAAELDFSEAIIFEPSIYLGDAAALLTALRRCPKTSETLLMVGHNPGISELAQRFKGTPPPVELRTAGLCSVAFAAEACWGALRADLATAVTLLR
jgi:phosphohistidine phosphatase